MGGSSNQQTFKQKWSTDQVQDVSGVEDEAEDCADEAADKVKPEQVFEKGKYQIELFS